MVEVFTYFDDFGTDSSKLHRKVLDLYIKNWSNQGFKVNVLSEREAKKHPDYRSYKRIVSHYPTVNGRQYEVACFLRWMALATVRGNLMTDYDVLNVDFDVWRYSDLVHNRNYDGIEILNFDVGRVPCAIHIANSNASEELLKILGSREMANRSETTIDGRTHVSDMHMFSALAIGDLEPVCHLADMNFPLRHFSSDSSGGLLGKIEKMQKLLMY